MYQKGAVKDLKIKELPNENPFCAGCVYGKQHRLEFPKNNDKIRLSTPGRLFHADLCGYMTTESLGGAKYFLLLMDDCSRYSFIYLLKDETEVLMNLNQFYVDVQSDGHRVECLRTDGGREFCNELVKNFLLSRNIQHQVTTPRAPEQNGFIERQNRTVLDSARAMLYARDLPIFLWAEAANTAVYMKYRTASATLNGMTPYEIWFGIKPSLSNLKIFGSECYVHVPKEQRTKWDAKSIKCMMVGYSEGNKAYRVYDPLKHRLSIRRDVIFNENNHYKIEPNVVAQISNSKVPGGEIGKLNTKNNDCFDPMESEETEKPRWRNPRIPISRDPYPTRKNLGSRSDVVDDEVVIAEAFLADLEPITLEEALESEDSLKWLEAMNSELNSLHENQTWTLVPRPTGKNVISNR